MTDTTPALRITARTHGFRRAGVAHPGTPTEYPAAHFTTDQLSQLKNEPELVVQVIDPPSDPPPKGRGKARDIEGAAPEAP